MKFLSAITLNLHFEFVQKNLKGVQIINLFSRDIPSKFMDQQETNVFLVFNVKQKRLERKF